MLGDRIAHVRHVRLVLLTDTLGYFGRADLGSEGAPRPKLCVSIRTFCRTHWVTSRSKLLFCWLVVNTLKIEIPSPASFSARCSWPLLQLVISNPRNRPEIISLGSFRAVVPRVRGIK
jgi:hypothetical protein